MVMKKFGTDSGPKVTRVAKYQLHVSPPPLHWEGHHWQLQEWEGEGGGSCNLNL